MAVTESAPLPAASETWHRLSFTGSGKEYFGIWIVNILLTIITVGIYSAWAKVRRNRYFYGNTVLLGRAFEYHAKGMQIFIGRIIVFAYLIIYNVLLTVVPLVGIGMAVLILFFIPWLVMRGLRFSARVTSYRNVRFNFVGGVGGAFLAFLVGPILAALTLGILAPLASRWMYRYIGNNMRYGTKAFTTDPGLGAIYKNWFLSALIILLGLLIIGFVLFINMSVLFAVIDNPQAIPPELHTALITMGVIGYLVVLVSFGIAALVYRAGVRNVAWSSSVFDGAHPLKSDLSRAGYVWITISNLIITLLTLGLMRPWAAVRMARYVNTHTAVRFSGDVGEVFAIAEKDGSAVGAEFMSYEGFDFGF